MVRKCFSCLAIALPGAIVSAGPVDVTVRVVPEAPVVQLGQSFTVRLYADISSPAVGWGLDLLNSMPSVASIVGVPTIGPAWQSAFASDNDGLAGLAFPNAVSGNDVLLATLIFHADSLGTTNLKTFATAGDLTEGFYLDGQATFAATSYGDAFVTVSNLVVPLPTAVSVGLVGIPVVFLRRRRTAGI